MSGSDDLGGLGDLDDADDDLGDLDGGGLDTGDLGDEGFDEGGFDDMDGGDEMAGGGGGNVDELEHRLDELENEVGSLSSTVNTVRNENEQISESVEEVEENVRKLLDIYEMVTRGVNPFADEVDAGMGMGGEMESDGSFGLFTDDGEDETTESVDEDITEADAEGFFDDDLVEEDDGDDFGGDADEMLDDGPDDGDEPAAETDAFQDAADDMLDEEPDDAFQQEPAVEESAGTSQSPVEESEPVDDDPGFEEMAAEQAASETDTSSAEQEPDLADDELFDQVIDEEEAAAPEAQQADSTATQPADESDAVTQDDAAGKPYLGTIPGGLGAELIVVEWLEYLVEEVGRRGASRALGYYESIDWITESVAERLESYLNEFEFTTPGDDTLGVAVHVQSLAFIEQLNGGDAGTADATSVEVFGP